ncbi:MAG: insulinase family protein [Ignavibacteriae bacterium]|nr:insulinase family protein [Ignavibacteriota bacterium]
MKNIIFALIMLAFAGNIFPQEVIELNLPKSDKVVIKLMFRNGSVCDPEGKEGLTRLTANLVTSGGTSDMTYSQVQEKIYPMAARYGVSVDKEVSIFTFQVHKDFLDEFYKILKGVILSPSFSQEDFDRVKSNQQNYVDQVIRTSSDEEYSKMALEDVLFGGTKYQYMVMGKSSGVKSITLDDVKSHYKNYFTKNNLLIGIAGNYPSGFAATIKNDLQPLSGANPALPEKVSPKMPDGVNVNIISKDAFGSAIFMGFPMDITRSSDDFAALMVANSYLGEHRKSYGLLYDKIRTTRSMNYGDYSYIEWYDNGGSNMLPPPGVPRSSNYFSIWIRPVQIGKQLRQQYSELSDVKLGHALFAIRLALREVDNIVKNGISEQDFEATREFLRSYIKLYVQTPASRLGYLMDSKFCGRKDFISEMDALLAKLTVDDVNRAVKKYWQIDNFFITVVTDNSEAEELAIALKENTPSPMSYSNLVKSGLPASVIAEDNEVANFKLNVKNVNIIKSEDTFK